MVSSELRNAFAAGSAGSEALLGALQHVVDQAVQESRVRLEAEYTKLRSTRIVLRGAYEAAAPIREDVGVQAGYLLQKEEHSAIYGSPVVENGVKSDPIVRRAAPWEEFELVLDRRGQEPRPDLCLVRCLQDQLEGYIKRADLFSPDLPFEQVEPTSIDVVPAAGGRASDVVATCELKMLSWNVYFKNKELDQLDVLDGVLRAGIHQVVLLQEVSSTTQDSIAELARGIGFDLVTAQQSELDSSSKRMRNALLVRRGCFQEFAVVDWTGAQLSYPPVTALGKYALAGDVRIGVTSFHTPGAGANRHKVVPEIARTLGRAAHIAAERDLDMMVVLGDANLQSAGIPQRGEVDMVLDGGIRVQCSSSHQKTLQPPNNALQGSQWWPEADAGGPWVIIRPSSNTTSGEVIADCAFVLRRRPVRAYGPTVTTWPFLCRADARPHEALGSDRQRSDHRPIEMTWIFGQDPPRQRNL